MVQIICFIISIGLYCLNLSIGYIILTWIEDVLLELIMVYWAFKINDLITIDLNAWLVCLGGVLSLGIAIFETYRECSMKDNRLGDESLTKE